MKLWDIREASVIWIVYDGHKFGQFQAHQYLRFVVCIKFGHEIIISVRLVPIPKYFEKKIIENP